jgi:hypothetical protein
MLLLKLCQVCSLGQQLSPNLHLLRGGVTEAQHTAVSRKRTMRLYMFVYLGRKVKAPRMVFDSWE